MTGGLIVSRPARRWRETLDFLGGSDPEARLRLTANYEGVQRPLTQRIAGAAIAVGSTALLIRSNEVDLSRRLVVAGAAGALLALVWTIRRRRYADTMAGPDDAESRAGARVAAGSATGLLGLCLALWPEDAPWVVYENSGLLLSTDAYEAALVHADRLPAGVAGTGAFVLAVVGVTLWLRTRRAGGGPEVPA